LKAIKMSPDQRHVSLPFFDEVHRELAANVALWTARQRIDEQDDREACRQWVRALGRGGYLRWCVPAAHGGALPALDSRALVIMRETLAFYSPLADFAFAMQGLGSGAITLAGTEAQRNSYLNDVGQGKKIAAFALSEPQAGSDAGALATTAVRDGNRWRLNGTKTWISNGGIADYYCLFAKTDTDAGTRGISCFLLDATTPGLDASQHIQVMAPHPLSTLVLTDCWVSDQALLGTENGGFKLAMQTLDIFRASVAAAALGFARRALSEAVAHAKSRKMFGQTLADFQLTQAKLGQMAADIDAAALLTYRAAWLRDESIRTRADIRVTCEAAMAKMVATENAQRVIDAALQLHGGLGVQVGVKIESLYRDIRSLRIYEGATEVQQLIIGKALLAGG
jgi:acyl-CoA dehydrogenase